MKCLLAGLTLAFLAACSPATGRIQPSLDTAPDVIDGAVSRTDAVELLTESTLRCMQIEAHLGLSQWVCEVDNSAGSDRARYVVTLLSDTDDRLRFVDAQVLATGESGSIEGFASFFRDTIVSRLIPELAGSDEAGRWIETSIGGSGSGEFGPAHMRLDRMNQTVRLQLSRAPGN